MVIKAAMKKEIRIALTGFMGVGKSSVARHLSQMLRCQRVDLDQLIEDGERRKIAAIIDADGIDQYRLLETKYLEVFLKKSEARILSLGGGTWTTPANRDLLRAHDFITVWLEST
ncbi:MAG: shikimate kinase, partial [Acidobacteriota bacterium]